jgi:hypothetical protein
MPVSDVIAGRYILNRRIDLGWIGVIKGDKECARKWLEELFALSLNGKESNMGISLASFDLNDYTKGERCPSEAVIPSTFPILKAMVLLRLPPVALVLSHNGQTERATELLALTFSHRDSPLTILVERSPLWWLHETL